VHQTLNRYTIDRKQTHVPYIPNINIGTTKGITLSANIMLILMLKYIKLRMVRNNELTKLQCLVIMASE